MIAPALGCNLLLQLIVLLDSQRAGSIICRVFWLSDPAGQDHRVVCIFWADDLADDAGIALHDAVRVERLEHVRRLEQELCGLGTIPEQ